VPGQLQRLWRFQDFRRLWIAQAISSIGDRIVLVALALYVTEQTGSTSSVGLVLAAHALPLVGFLLLGGVWADRLPRKQILVVTDLVRAGLHAVLAVLIFAGSAEVWMIMVIEALFGAAEAFFRPAVTGLIPQSVPEEHIQDANALIGVSRTGAEFAGPALATALVVGLGAGWAFAVDAATFVVSAWFVVRMHPRARGEARARQTVARELAEGWHEVRSRDWVWVTIAVFSAGLLVGLAPWFVLGPTVAEEQYGGASDFGVLAAAMGLGTIVGSLAGLRWRPARPMLVAFWGIVPWPLSLIAFGLGAPFALTVALCVAMGVGFGLFGVLWETALAQHVPPHALSRVTAYDWMGSLALLPLGYVLFGVLADHVDAADLMLAGGVLLAVAMAAGFLPRGTRTLRQPEGVSAAAPRRVGNAPPYSGVT
jgi:MFS family permease